LGNKLEKESGEESENKLQNEWQSAALHQILRKMRKDGSFKVQTKHNLSPLYPAS
jgi:hypothetical protein